jgi:ABC-type transporter Mla subunit MlaD
MYRLRVECAASGRGAKRSDGVEGNGARSGPASAARWLVLILPPSDLMPRPARWRDLRGGLISLGAIVGLSLGILFFGNVNSLHGSTMRLYAAVGSARGVLRGTEVWLYGRKVGLVDGVSFMPASTDTVQRLVVSMEVLERFRENIRTDAAVQIRSGTSMIGSPIVYISGGSARAPAISNGDTILAVPQNDFEQATSQFAIASREFPAIIANVRVIAEALRGTESTIGALGIDKGGPDLDAAQGQLRRLGRKLDAAHGTIGLALKSGPSLSARAQRALARADSLRALVSSGRSSVGRFRADTMLFAQVRDVHNELSIVRALMHGPNGNVGRFASDSAVYRAITNAEREMGALVADAKHHPMRYVHF